MLLRDPLLKVSASKPEINTYTKSGELTGVNHSLNRGGMATQKLGGLLRRHDLTANAARLQPWLLSSPLHPLLLRP
jgi:hypothetical protein